MVEPSGSWRTWSTGDRSGQKQPRLHPVTWRDHDAGHASTPVPLSSWRGDGTPDGDRSATPDHDVREHQANRLKRAAAELAAEGGAAAVTTGALASRSGVSRTSLYEIFGSTQACAYAAAEETVDMLVARLDASDGPTAGERLHAAVRELFEFCAEHPLASRLALVEIVGIDAEGARRRRRALDRLGDPIEARVAQAYPQAPELAPRLLVGGLFDIATTRLAAGRAAELPDLLPELVDTLLGGATR